jgi:hypothetical protein
LHRTPRFTFPSHYIYRCFQITSRRNDGAPRTGPSLELERSQVPPPLPPTQAVRGPIAQCRLPYELAVKIFCELLPCSPSQMLPHSHHLRRRDRMPCWLAIAHVCRYWRTIVFNSCRCLWAYLPVESPAWLALALERSKPSPIYIDAGLDVFMRDIANPGALSIALASSSRAAQISLATQESRSMVQWLEMLRALEAPNLERLELIFFPSGRDMMPMIPLDIFHREVPIKLRHLVVIDVLVLPRTTIFSPSLTHLELAVAHPAWETLGQTFDTLSALPNLEYLALMRGTVLPPWHTGDPYATTGSRFIHLPRLKTLRLNGDACVVLRSLQTIGAPNCEVSCLVFALERDAAGVPEDPTAVAAGQTHPRWPDLPSIPNAILSAYMSDFAPSKTMRNLVVTSAMDPVCHSISELTALLRNVPGLRTLTMRCSPWHELPERPAEDVAPAHMENLESLHLWSRFPHVLSTLSDYIVIPPTAERHVTVDGGPPDNMSLTDFVQTFREVYQLPAMSSADETLSYQHLTVAELKDSFFFGVSITVSDPTLPAHGQRALPPKLELNIPILTLGKPHPVTPPPEAVAHLVDLTAAVLAIFPLAECKEVTVAHLLFEDESLWYRAFVPLGLPSVTKLHVRPGPAIARAAVRALCASRLPGHCTLFPALSCLHLEQVDFADPAFEPCAFPLAREFPETTRHPPPYLLEVSRSYVDAEILTCLRRDFASGVLWDGVCDASVRAMRRSWRRESAPIAVPVAPASVPVVPVALTVTPALPAPVT